jgi:flavin-dependent dehydrogenase
VISTRIPLAFLSLGAFILLFVFRMGEPRDSPSFDAAPASKGRAALRQNGAAVVEPEREIPITHRADVVVVGATVGGLGGCMAAVAAARQGAETILIEESGHIDPHVPLGLGVVIGIEGWRPAIREGLCRDFVRYLVEMGQHYYQPLTEEALLARGEIIIRYHEVVTTAMLKMLQDAGVKMLLHARAAGAVVEDGKLQALIIESPQGRHAVAGKVFVDST